MRAAPHATTFPCAPWLLWVTLAAAGCVDSSYTMPRSSSGDSVSAPALSSSPLRSGDRKLRLLFGGAAGADLLQHGLVVDLGSGNHLKYAEGEARATWGQFFRGDASSTRAVVLNGARLAVYDRGGVEAVVLRARSRTACSVELVLDGVSAGAQRLQGGWTNLRFALARATAEGARTLELRLTYDGRPVAPVEAQWLWLSTGGTAPTAVQRAGKRTFGEPMPSLLADRPRTYSFQIQVPEQCNLVFDYGAKTLTLFEVDLVVGREEPLSMFAARASRPAWYQAWIDLSDYAGKQVRLELRTRTPHGRAGVISGAAWGDPLLSCSGDGK